MADALDFDLWRVWLSAISPQSIKAGYKDYFNDNVDD